MKQEVQTKIMAARKNTVVDKRESKLMRLSVAYQPLVFNTERVLSADVRITPKAALINSPLEIELRGFSNLQTLNSPAVKTQDNFEDTVEIFMENEEKSQKKELMSITVPVGLTKTEYSQKPAYEEGQYFLQGCLVLYQLSDKSKNRLQSLEEGKQYVYPVQFMLPNNLPDSLDDILIKNIHITIRYTLELKIITVDNKGNNEVITHVLPFEITSPPKVYPYEKLVVLQRIRCYHPLGKKQDRRINHPMTRFVKCLCPNPLFQAYLRRNQIMKTSCSNYDLFHLELIVVVYEDHSIHLTVRSYKDPQTESLTQHRQKQESRPQIKSISSLGQVPNENDLSKVSMKDTTRKTVQLCVQKVEVELLAQIDTICQQSVFKKVILLNQSHFDMVQGETIVKLTQLLACPRSFNNELFTLSYRFTATALFGEGEDLAPTAFENFVVEQSSNELTL